MMKIWIDLTNSPHIGFFLPLMPLLSNNNKVFITLRDFCQTVELARTWELEALAIGKHGGKGLAAKLLNLFYRSFQLVNFAKGKEIDLAVSHNSYTQIVAGRLVGATQS